MPGTPFFLSSLIERPMLLFAGGSLCKISWINDDFRGPFSVRFIAAVAHSAVARTPIRP
jgi:hypothetical protein